MKLQSNGSINMDMLGRALYDILNHKIPCNTCKEAVAELRNRIKSAVGIYGMTVSIRGFGTLGITKCKTRKARDIKSGETIIVPEKEYPALKVSKEWKEIVNMIDSKKRNEVKGMYKPQDVFLGDEK